MKNTRLIMKFNLIGIVLLLLLATLGCDQHPWGYFPDIYGNVDLSPDGQKIAYMHYVENGQEPPVIYIMDLKTRKKTKLHDVEMGYSCSPKWSTDGSRILFQDGILYLENNKVVNIRSNKKLELSPYHYATWSPNQEQILIGDYGGLFICDTSFNNVEKLSIDTDYANWHPNGMGIIYSKNDEICINDISGDNETILVNNKSLYGNLHPVFSPDAKTIAWERYDGICIMEIGSGIVKKVDMGDKPIWDRESLYLYYEKPTGKKPFDTNIWRINIETNEKEQLTQ